MQRLLSLKLASKLPKKLSDLSSSTFLSHEYKTLSHTTTPTVLLHSLTSPTTTFHQPPAHFLFSNFTTFQAWLSSHHNTVSKRVIHGILSVSNPVTVKQYFLSNTHFRFPSKDLNNLMGCRVWFLRAQSAPWKNLEFAFGFLLHVCRSWFRRLPIDDVLLGLIAANAAVFMLWKIADPDFMKNNFLISLDNVTSGRVHTMLTSAFSHVGNWHLISNMIGLFCFGRPIGKVFGAEYLLKLYLAGAITGSVFFMLYHEYMALTSKGEGSSKMDHSKVAATGASGAVNAIIFLSIFLFPKSTIYVDFIIPVPAMLVGVYLIGKDMLRVIGGDSQISGSVHLGGAVVAAIAWARIRRRFFF